MMPKFLKRTDKKESKGTYTIYGDENFEKILKKLENSNCKECDGLILDTNDPEIIKLVFVDEIKISTAWNRIKGTAFNLDLHELEVFRDMLEQATMFYDFAMIRYGSTWEEFYGFISKDDRLTFFFVGGGKAGRTDYTGDPADLLHQVKKVLKDV